MDKSNRREFFTIFTVVFMDLLGFGIILPLLPYIAENFHASPSQIGLLIASYSIFQFISSPILGKLSDRYGRKKLLVISQIGSALGFLVLGLANSLPLLFASRILDGITGGNISIAQAYMADITNRKNRAKGMGILGAAFGLGFIFGPVIGGLLSNISFAAPAFFAATIAILTAITTATFLRETVDLKKAKKKKQTRFSIKNLQKVLETQPIGLMIVVFFILILGFSGIQGTFALWVERSFDWGPKEVGYAFALIGVVSIITQILIVPRVVDKYGERKVLKTAIPILALGFAWFLIAKTPILLIPAIVMIALGNGLVNPTIQAIASESVPQEQYGETLGILQSAGSLGRIGGPIIAGILFDNYGKDSPFALSSIIILFVALIINKNLDDQESLLTKVKRFFA